MLQPQPIILWPLSRVQIAGELILLVCAVALTLILYVLLRPVNKNLALLAVFFNIVEFPIEATSKLCLFAALFLSGNADYLKALEPHQLHALVNISLKLHARYFRKRKSRVALTRESGKGQYCTVSVSSQPL